MTKLIFPSEYSLGKLVIYNDWRGKAREVPNAQGAIQIAENDRVILTVNEETCYRMERLREIKPNILHGVSIYELEMQWSDLSELSRLSGLELVGLYKVRVSPAQLQQLAGLSGLRFLHLNFVKLLPSLGWMNKMHRLEILGLGFSDIGDMELQTLPPLEISTLMVYGTRVSDQSIAKLASLQSLTWLDVSETRMTEEGRSRLAELLPNCRIRDDGGVRRSGKIRSSA